MIGIIGAGNMGRALASRINQKVIISDAIKSKLRFAKNRRISAAIDNIDLARRSGVIILAVKPQDIIKVLREIRPYTAARLIISIAAGVETSSIEKTLGNRARVVRVMPNMPALVGKGISAIARGKFAAQKDANMARRIFSRVGEVVEVKEGLMDAVTAVSGSGPAYYFLFTDLLEKAGIKTGLKKDLARKLAMATFTGAAECARLSSVPMQDFVKKVASKGGTTEAALSLFKEKRLKLIVEQAVKEAYKRSRNLSK